MQPVLLEKPETDDSDEEDSKVTTSNKVEELPRKKTGRPLLIGEELDAQVQQYVKESRKCGLPINTAVVVAAGLGVVTAHDANLLDKNCW